MATFFAGRPKPSLRAVLFDGDRELDEVVRLGAAAWQLRGRSATGVARFGPFVESTSFDAVVLFDGAERLHDFPIARSTLGPGASYEHELIVAVG